MKNRLFLILMAISLILAGCGDSSDDQDVSNPSEQVFEESPSPSPEPSETVTPEVSAVDTPAENQSPAPSLPGLSPVDIYLNLEEEPYSFKFGEWAGEIVQSKCGSRADTDTNAELTACIYSSNLNDVLWVEAAVEGSEITAASWFFSYMATVPYEGSEPEKAAQWVKGAWEKVKKEGETFTQQFGDVLFEIYGNGKTSIFLEIKPSKGLDEWLSKVSVGQNGSEGGSDEELSEDEIREALKNLGLSDEEIDKQIEESKK